jgi:ribonuclease HI
MGCYFILIQIKYGSINFFFHISNHNTIFLEGEIMLINEYNIDNLNIDNLIIVYCDGSCYYKDRIGGYGIFLVSGNYSKKMSGGSRDTTISRMELTGMIEALKIVDKSYKTVIFCDSEYTTNCINKGWIKLWNEFLFVGKKNEDLLKIYLEEYNKFPKGNIIIKHIRGHIGIKGNEIADKLAKGAREKVKKEILKLK